MSFVWPPLGCSSRTRARLDVSPISRYHLRIIRLFLLLFAVGGDDDDGGGGGGACDIVIRKHLSLAPFAKKRIVSAKCRK